MVNIAYWLEKFGDKIPFLLYKNYYDEKEELVRDYQASIHIKEKIIIVCERLYCWWRCWIGIRVAYIVCGAVFIYRNWGEEIRKVCSYVVDIVISVDYIRKLQMVYDYVKKNGNGILIIAIIVLIVYINYLKRNNRKFVFETAWQNEIENKITEISNAQKEIQNYLGRVYRIIWHNVDKLKDIITILDHEYKYDSDNYSYNGDIKLESYENIVGDIKECIANIEKNDGRRMYWEYNKKMWNQLRKLSLTDSDKRFLMIDDILSCDKKSIERTVQLIGKEPYESIRKSLMMQWTMGIASLNGIERYFKYVARRKRKHNRLYTRINKTITYKEIVGEIRDIVE